MPRFVIERPASVPQAMPTALRRPALLPRLFGRIVIWAWWIGETLLLWQERYRQRRAIGTLSDHILKDLGLSRADLSQESGKRFWEP